MLLAFYGAVQETVGGGILSTPLSSVRYDDQKNKLYFTQFEGIAQVPRKNEHNISTLDMIFACNAQDIPLLLEGDTGVGKTITTETYLKSILGGDHSIVMSLSHHSFTDSPKAPFEFSKMEEGVPKVYINEEKLRTIALMYIDEFNLGNPNDLLQLSQGRVLVSTGRGTAGIPIPQLGENGVSFDEEDHLKRLWVSGSQNPPQARDAAFSGMELTASLKNRFLVVQYPKIVKSVGTTMWLTEKKNYLHPRFLDSFRKRYSTFIGQAVEKEDVKGDWPSLYAYIMNRKRTEKDIISSSLEFGDLLMVILSGDLAESYQVEKEVAEGWKSALPSGLGSNFNLSDTIQDSQEVQRFNEIMNSFDKPLTERDDDHIKSLADLLAMIKSLKAAYKSKDPLQTYLRQKWYITIEDVAAGVTLLTRNKQIRDAPDPLHVVNSILKEYTGLMDELAAKMSLKGYTKFNTSNPSIGLKRAIYTASLNEASTAEQIVQRMNHYMGQLKNLGNGTDMRKVIIARTLGDLTTAAGFIMTHQDDVDDFLKRSVSNKSGEETGRKLKTQIARIYYQESGNPALPIIYTHRLPRVLG